MLRHVLRNKLLSCSLQLTYPMLSRSAGKTTSSNDQILKRESSNVKCKLFLSWPRSNYSRHLMTSPRSLLSFSTTIKATMPPNGEHERSMRKPAALLNYSATDMEKWLVGHGILVPDPTRKWSFDGSYFTNVVKSEQLQSYRIPQDKLEDTYYLLQPCIECEEKNLVALVLDIIDTIPFKHLHELPPCNHKALLGDFYKRDLNFNPYNPDIWDIRFLPKTGTDPVYDMFDSFAKAPAKASYNLYALKALSGGGKTGVMLNAVGRNKHLIFVECTFPGIIDTKDYFDGAFLDFAAQLADHAHSMSEPHERTKHALLKGRVFWLCRLMLLKVMQEKWAISPEEWIFWTNSSGQQYLTKLQQQFHTLLINDMARGKTFAELENILRLLIESYICDTGAWFAVDEAQAAEKAGPKYKKIGDEYDTCSLLHVMTINALSANSKRIIAGTSLPKFVHHLKSGSGKGSQLFDLDDAAEEFPYVKPDDAWGRLEQYFNFDEIDQKSINDAKHILQGRLRYVFGFIRALAKTIALSFSAKKNKEDKLTKNAIFLQALDNFKLNLKKNFLWHWKELKDKRVSTKHLVHVLLAQRYAPTLTWSAKQIEENFGVSVEETGFLFVEKSKLGFDGEIVYSIKEPFVVSSLMKIPEVASKIARYIAEIKLTVKEIGSAEPQEIGKMAKNYILWCFVNDFESFMKTVPDEAPFWVKYAACEWISGGAYSKYMELLDQVKVLLQIEPLIKEWLASQAPEPDLAEALASNKAFAALVRDDMTLDRSTVEQLAAICYASKEQQPELLYLLLRPKDYWLCPSKQLGPDLIGFLSYKNDDVLVTVSMSLQKEDEKKFENNKTKTDPAQFYRYLKTAGEITAPAIYEAFNRLPTLPKKALRLNLTIPHHENSSYESLPSMLEEHYLVHINQDTLHTLGFNLARTLQELAPKY